MTKFGMVGVWPVDTYFPNAIKFWSGGPAIACGDFRQFFTVYFVKHTVVGGGNCKLHYDVS